MTEPIRFHVSNRTLLAVLVSLFTWELSLFAFAIRWLGLGQLPTEAWVILLVAFTAGSIAGAVWAWNEARRIPGPPSGIVLTPAQNVIVVMFVLAFSLPLSGFCMIYFG